jgi:GT2 family glycosyltransferase
MLVSVLVPTYLRHHDLARCLAALRVQRRAPDVVLVTLREEDEESRALTDELASSWPALRTVAVAQRGVVAAMNAALAVAEGDVLALTDDDAEPLEDWLERIVTILETEPDVGGAGGRDEQVASPGTRKIVGQLQWFGGTIGSHHLGGGPACDVDVLRGANCAFRLPLLRAAGFDERLRGQGVQVHWELALCLAIRRAGWRLVYDPTIRVRHHVTVHHDTDQPRRGRFDAALHMDAVYNETLVLAEHLSPTRRTAFALWSAMIGTSAEPGLLQLPRVLVNEGRVALRRWRATQRARREGLREAARNRRMAKHARSIPKPPAQRRIK